MSFRAARQVATTTSGDFRSDRSWSMTAASISPACSGVTVGGEDLGDLPDRDALVADRVKHRSGRRRLEREAE